MASILWNKKQLNGYNSSIWCFSILNNFQKRKKMKSVLARGIRHEIVCQNEWDTFDERYSRYTEWTVRPVMLANIIIQYFLFVFNAYILLLFYPRIPLHQNRSSSQLRRITVYDSPQPWSVLSQQIQDVRLTFLGSFVQEESFWQLKLSSYLYWHICSKLIRTKTWFYLELTE